MLGRLTGHITEIMSFSRILATSQLQQQQQQDLTTDPTAATTIIQQRSGILFELIINKLANFQSLNVEEQLAVSIYAFILVVYL